MSHLVHTYICCTCTTCHKGRHRKHCRHLVDHETDFEMLRMEVGMELECQGFTELHVLSKFSVNRKRDYQRRGKILFSSSRKHY